MAATSTANDTTSNILLYILAIFLPPVSVYLKTGCDGHFILNIILLILTWIPAIIHAFYVIYTRRGTSHLRERYLEKNQTLPQAFPPQQYQPQSQPQPQYPPKPQSQPEIQTASAAPPYPYAEAPTGPVHDEKHEYRPAQQ